MLGDFIKKDDNLAGVSATPTFAEDRAARLATINPFGLRTSSTAQLISEREWAPTNGYGYGGATNGITGAVADASTSSGSPTDLSGGMASVLLSDLGPRQAGVALSALLVENGAGVDLATAVDLAVRAKTLDKQALQLADAAERSRGLGQTGFAAAYKKGRIAFITKREMHRDRRVI